jgi:hypothetical protein
MTQSAIVRRYEGVQTFLTEGCLFLSLCSIAEQVVNGHIDILSTIQYAKAEGWIDSNNDMTEASQCALLGFLTGKQWHREFMKVLPTIVPVEMFTVEKWMNSRTGKTHFRRRFVDTLERSVTVTEGTCVGYYGYCYE